MALEPAADVHALLRIDAVAALTWDGQPERAPAWASASLQRAPWVVVRRAAARADELPVGVRGSTREQRAAAWISRADIQRIETPLSLAVSRGWQRLHDATPAIAALTQAQLVLEAHGWAGRWGPGGSAGFELASGRRTTHSASDLDLILYPDARYEHSDANDLLAALSSLPVRCDVLLEAPMGAVSLAEYAQQRETLLLRTRHGPRLVQDPWQPDTATVRRA